MTPEVRLNLPAEEKPCSLKIHVQRQNRHVVTTTSRQGHEALRLEAGRVLADIK